MLLDFVLKHKKIIAPSVASIAVIAAITIFTLTTDNNSNPLSKNSDEISKSIVINHNNPTPTQVSEVTVAPKKVSTPTSTKSGPTPTKSASAVQSNTGNTTVTPTTQPNTSNSSPTSTPTPTPIQSGPTAQPYPMFSGKHINTDGNSVSLPNMKVKVTHDSSGASQESTGSTFEFKSLTPGTYKVEAQSVEGYNIQHSVCFNCNADDHFYDASSFMVNVTSTHTSIGLTFKYVAK